MDSDDYIELNQIEVMLKYACEYNSDIVIAGFFIEALLKTVPSELVNEVVTLKDPKELMKMYLTTHFISGLLWNKIYRKKLWEDIRFPIYRASEDNAVSYKIFDKASTAVVIPERFYHYVANADSVEHKMVIKDHLVSVDVAEERYEYISSKYPDLENAVNCNRWSIRVAMYKRLFMVNQQNQYKATLGEWIDFFRKNQAPAKEWEIERDRILRHPHAYGYYLGCKYRLKNKIKRLLRKGRRKC